VTETEWYDHESSPLSVEELREALSGLPADAPVVLSSPDEAEGSSSSLINAVTVELRPARTGQPEQLVIGGSHPSGRYPRSGRRSLTVIGLPTG
jgi:hypothetical protein